MGRLSDKRQCVQRYHSCCCVMHSQVVPTCTCPASVNVKDCCAGIMCALMTQDRFAAWFGKNWFRKELLDRRNRADCDSFLEIGELRHRPPVKRHIDSSAEDSISRKLLTPSSVKSKFERAIENAGTDQHIVR